MKKQVLLFLLITIIFAVGNAQIIPTIFDFEVSSDFGFGLYRPGFQQSNPNLCLNPICDEGTVINVFIGDKFNCSLLPSNASFLSPNGSNPLGVDFNVNAFLGNVLYDDACTLANILEKTQLLANLPGLTSAIRINVIVATQALPKCNGTCPVNEVVINIYVPNDCNEECLCIPTTSSSPTNEEILVSFGKQSVISKQVCLNAEYLILQGISRPYSNLEFIAFIYDDSGVVTKKRQIQQLSGSSSIDTQSGLANGQFYFTPNEAFSQINFGLLNNQTGVLITFPFSSVFAARKSSGSLQGGYCEGADCCNLTIDCISSIIAIEAYTINCTIGSTYPAGLDILCPYPVCNWRYMYDATSDTCISPSTISGVVDLTHVPYESLQDCTSDFSRSTTYYCLEPLTKAYRVCKHNVGLP